MSAEEPWRLAGHPDSRAWVPEGMVAVEDLNAYRYLVVDELIEEIVTLAVASWPHLDEHGRLVFEEESGSVGVRGADLMAFLAESRRLPPGVEVEAAAEEQARTRPLRLGDAFAARQKVPPREAQIELVRGDHHARVVDPVEWLEAPVYDVTQQARQAAKLAFYAAATPVLKPEEVLREFADVATMTEDVYNVLAPPPEEGQGEPAGAGA